MWCDGQGRHDIHRTALLISDLSSSPKVSMASRPLEHENPGKNRFGGSRPGDLFNHGAPSSAYEVAEEGVMHDIL